MRVVMIWSAIIALGTLLFRLPPAAEGPSIPWIDALFTSTSAMCVTGLTTINVGERLSTFGEAVLLLLIQLGGLGITTVSTFLLVAAGRVSLSHQVSTKESLAAVRVKPLRLLWWVVATTIVLEAIGAALLARQFSGPDRWWLGIFHSVSAFCNAGFSLFPDSLERYAADRSVTLTVATLIVLGGLGFIALRQLFLWAMGLVRRKHAPLFLHTRAVLLASAVLWALGMLMFSALESGASMRDLPASARPLAGLFQSVTARTAGFNTVDFAQMRESTLFFTMFLMFIGGAPGSCAGGIKVTTAMVILATLVARTRAHDTVTLLRRTVPQPIVRRSFQLLTLSLLFLTVIVAGLLITQETTPLAGGRSDRMLTLSFEAVSAFGTVGLTTGETPLLTPAGKLLIIVCMFVGRLGPLVVAVAVFQPRGGPVYEYPREELAIG